MIGSKQRTRKTEKEEKNMKREKEWQC